MLGRRRQNILVIKTDGLASFVAAEPAFEAIRRTYPNATISLLTTQELQRIARASPYFDQVAAAPDLRNPEARKDLIKQLRSSRFEKVFDLAGDRVGRKLHGAMGPFRPKWHATPPPASGRMSKKQKTKAASLPPDVGSMLSGVGIDVAERLPDFGWALAARKDSANMKPSWYGVSAPFGLLLPSVEPDARWPAECYAELAGIMAGEGIMPVLAGPRDLHQLGDEVAHETPQLVDLAGKTDHLQLAALAREAAFFVSDNAEEMHLAVSVGCQGVLITNAKNAHLAPSGRHVVTLTAQGDLGSIDPAFAWRTLVNMGLVEAAGAGKLAQNAR